MALFSCFGVEPVAEARSISKVGASGPRWNGSSQFVYDSRPGGLLSLAWQATAELNEMSSEVDNSVIFTFLLRSPLQIETLRVVSAHFCETF